ncbi:uncharacterized protein LOC128626279 isoform X2 [Artibeus jamaicensis]|nr:uncharacterized protein LOC128626279 isoform X2 [Artibeus jamaicensis]
MKSVRTPRLRLQPRVQEEASGLRGPAGAGTLRTQVIRGVLQDETPEAAERRSGAQARGSSITDVRAVPDVTSSAAEPRDLPRTYHSGAVAFIWNSPWPWGVFTTPRHGRRYCVEAAQVIRSRSYSFRGTRLGFLLKVSDSRFMAFAWLQGPRQ